MKGLVSAGLAVLLLMSGSLGAQAAQIEGTLKNGDAFYAERVQDAILPSESVALEVGYRVSLPEDAQSDVPNVRTLRYELALVNKTGQSLKELRFTAHFPESLQKVLAAPNWYNEPMALEAGRQGFSDTVVYTWEPFVMLEDLGILGSAELADFYEMLIEVEWAGGGEVIRLNQDCAEMPEEIQAVLEERPALDQAQLDDMMAAGREILEDRAAAP